MSVVGIFLRAVEAVCGILVLVVLEFGSVPVPL